MPNHTRRKSPKSLPKGGMPPWFASEQFGHFANRRSLSADEKEKIANWVRGGMEMGDASQLPKETTAKTEAKPADRWLIGKPDLVLGTAKSDLPATGLIDYKYVPLLHAFFSDTWMQGIQILPDNPRAVHHCNMAYIMPADKKKQSHFITGTVPGGVPWNSRTASVSASRLGPFLFSRSTT